ncbi:(2Fe-2S)-binding protein [Homoserinimonas sp. OAct 916]|uniref:(2Fe-2S)-binding protein n=1 Tax=Homoserinimonas sp. OAct 916 TaxID=2211450 RepID=UPI000DBE6BB2|nr:(2Fe-2S)-binding protein [Homoserinimonas sp. OAct 916]
MTARLLPASEDPIAPDAPTPLTITVDGVLATGVAGQTLAGVILASGSLAWRRTSASGKPRGVFCGIGVCFDCVVEVNGHRDVRACLRRATDGDVVVSQHDLLPKPYEQSEQSEQARQPLRTEQAPQHEQSDEQTQSDARGDND